MLQQLSGGGPAAEFLSVRLTKKPVVIDVTKALTGLITVISGSRRAYVIAIESTPVSGVEIINEATAPLPAPCSFIPAAAGNTPQLQRGRGIPTREDLTTLEKRPPPRCRLIISLGTKAFRSPATRNPKIINGEESSRTSQDE